MEIICKYKEGKRTIYTVKICHNRYVDVMYIEKSCICYVMQEPDGKIVFDESHNTFDCEIDEMDIVMFVRRCVSAA